jgi:WD40 repeat protein
VISAICHSTWQRNLVVLTVVFLLAVLLTACGTESPAPSITAESPTLATISPTQRVLIVPSWTPTMGAPVADTSTPRPTYTPWPSETPVPQRTQPEMTPTALPEGLARLGPGACLAFSSDGSLLAGGAEKIVLWDVQTQVMVASVGTAARRCDDMALSAEGMLTLGQGAVLSFYDVGGIEPGTTPVEIDEPAYEFLAHPEMDQPVINLAYNGDDTRLATLGQSGLVRTWDTSGLQSMPGEYSVSLVNTIQSVITTTRMTYSPDARWLVLSDELTRIWDAQTGLAYETLMTDTERLKPEPPGLVGFSGDSQSLVTVWYDEVDGTWVYWRNLGTLSATSFSTLYQQGNNGWPYTSVMAMDVDRLILATASFERSTQETRLELWDLNTGQSYAGASVPAVQVPGLVTQMALSPDGLRLAVVSDGVVWLWKFR